MKLALIVHDMIVYIENHKDVMVLIKEKNCRSVEQNRQTRKRHKNRVNRTFTTK